MNYKKAGSLLAVALLAAYGARSWAQSVAATRAMPTGPLEAQVIELEKRRCTALLQQDIGALEGMLADDLIYIKEGGIRQNKTQYLADITAGKARYSSYSSGHPNVHVFANAAVVHGSLVYDSAADQPVRQELLYTGVYVLTHGVWQLTNWEETAKRK